MSCCCCCCRCCCHTAVAVVFTAAVVVFVATVVVCCHCCCCCCCCCHCCCFLCCYCCCCFCCCCCRRRRRRYIYSNTLTPACRRFKKRNKIDCCIMLIMIIGLIVTISGVFDRVHSLRVVYVVPTFRLFCVLQTAKRLLLTLVAVLVPFLNVGGLLLVVFSSYAILGMNLFAGYAELSCYNATRCDYVSQHNFDSTLSRCVLLLLPTLLLLMMCCCFCCCC